VTKRLKRELIGESYLDDSWMLNNERKLNGEYIYYEIYTETHIIEEVE
jgi:hypothetical protein